MTEAEDDEKLQQALEIFQMHVEGTNNGEIAKITGLAPRTVGNRLALARKLITEELVKEGKSYFADLWKKYDYIFEEARNEWKSTKNPAFITAMNQVLKALREMLGSDAPPKSPGNVDTGSKEPIMILLDGGDEEYKEKEKTYEAEVKDIPTEELAKVESEQTDG